MPIFEYKCIDCNSKYEIFHLVKEKKEDNICPSCGSKKSDKLLSTFSANTSSQSHSNDIPSCATGNCGFNPYAGGCNECIGN